MSRRTSLPALAALAVALAGFGALVLSAQARPDGPVPIAWDKEPCAHCRMHVGEPAYAAQLQLEDGRVLSFDDPGCLFRWLEKHQDPVHATWLHHSQADAWIPRADVGFVEASGTPMGFGLAAVPAAEATLRWDEAAARIAARPRRKP